MSADMESKVRVGVALLLWGVSGFLTVNLFLTLAGAGGGWPVAILWAAGLEGGKALSWRRGGYWRILAVCLSAVTIFAVLATAWQKVEDARFRSAADRVTALEASLPYLNASSQLKAAQELVATLTARVATIPGDASPKATLDALAAARAEVTRLSKDLEDQLAAVGRGAGRTIFEALAGAEGAAVLELVVSLILALLTEVTALSLMGRTRPSAASLPVPVTPELYVREATKGMPEGQLRGRKEVAQALGASERQVRYARAEAKRAGLIPA